MGVSRVQTWATQACLAAGVLLLLSGLVWAQAPAENSAENQAALNSCLKVYLPKLRDRCSAVDRRGVGIVLQQLIGSCIVTDSNVNVTILGPDYGALQYLTSVQPPDHQWPNMTVQFVRVPFPAWTTDVLNIVSSNNGTITGALIDPIVLDDLRDSDLLDLSGFLPQRVDWSGIHLFHRHNVILSGGVIKSIPFGSISHLMFYRSDVLQTYNLSVPQTWEDLLEALAVVNGTTSGHGDGVNYGLCLPRGPGCGGHALTAIWSSYAQSRGTEQGAYFDPVSMKPRASSAAMKRAVEIYQQLRLYEYPGVLGCPPLVEPFMAARCTFAIYYMNQFKAAIFSNTSAISATVRAAAIPGASQVLDYSAGLLAPCTPQLCPYAQPHPDRRKSGALVNRAPFIGMGTMSVGIFAGGNIRAQLQAFDTCALWASSKVSWNLITIPHTELGPFRNEHFDVAGWAAVGYPADRTAEWLGLQLEAIENPNRLPEVRTLKGSRYRAALNAAAQASNLGSSPQVVVELLSQLLAAAYGASYANITTEAQQVYWSSIGFINGTAPSPQPPSPSPPPVLEDVSGGDAKSSDLLAILLPTLICGTAALALGLGSWAVIRRGRLSKFRSSPVPPPPLGPSSTLLVTDVERSTDLWEALEPDVMDTVMDLHHNCIRKVALKWRGYESQTEGDSFILAFCTAVDALGFALEVQKALMEQDWPAQLLEHPAGRAVFVAHANLSHGSSSAGAGGGMGLLPALVALGPLGWFPADSLRRDRLPRQTSGNRARRSDVLQNQPDPDALSQGSGGGVGVEGLAGSAVYGGATSTRAERRRSMLGHDLLLSKDRGMQAAMMAAATGTGTGTKSSDRNSSTAASSMERDRDTGTGAGGERAGRASLLPTSSRQVKRTDTRSSQVTDHSLQEHLPCREPAGRDRTAQEDEKEAERDRSPMRHAAHPLHGSPLPLGARVLSRRYSCLECEGSPHAVRAGVGAAHGDQHLATATAGSCTWAGMETIVGESSVTLAARHDDSYTRWGGPKSVLRSNRFSIPGRSSNGTDTVSRRISLVGGGTLDKTVGAAAAAVWGRPTTFGALLRQLYRVVPPDTPNCIVAYRGLCVRIGMHSGIHNPSDLVYSEVAARIKYSGEVLEAAKTTSDTAHGGQVVLDESCKQQLSCEALAPLKAVLWCMGEHLFKSIRARDTLYLAVCRTLLPRLALEDPPHLRTSTMLLAGVPEAPVDYMALAAMAIVGWEAACARSSEAAAEVWEAFRHLGLDGLLTYSGYCTACQDGMISASFTSAYRAILWALDLQSAMAGLTWPAPVLTVFEQPGHAVSQTGSGALHTAAADGSLGPLAPLQPAMGHGPAIRGIITWGGSRWTMTGPSAKVVYEGKLVSMTSKLLSLTPVNTVLATSVAGQRAAKDAASLAPASPSNPQQPLSPRAGPPLHAWSPSTPEGGEHPDFLSHHSGAESPGFVSAQSSFTTPTGGVPRRPSFLHPAARQPSALGPQLGPGSFAQSHLRGCAYPPSLPVTTPGLSQPSPMTVARSTWNSMPDAVSMAIAAGAVMAYPGPGKSYQPGMQAAGAGFTAPLYMYPRRRSQLDHQHLHQGHLMSHMQPRASSQTGRSGKALAYAAGIRQHGQEMVGSSSSVTGTHAKPAGHASLSFDGIGGLGLSPAHLARLKKQNISRRGGTGPPMAPSVSFPELQVLQCPARLSPTPTAPHCAAAAAAAANRLLPCSSTASARHLLGRSRSAAGGWACSSMGPRTPSRTAFQPDITTHEPAAVTTCGASPTTDPGVPSAWDSNKKDSGKAPRSASPAQHPPPPPSPSPVPKSAPAPASPPSSPGPALFAALRSNGRSLQACSKRATAPISAAPARLDRQASVSTGIGPSTAVDSSAGSSQHSARPFPSQTGNPSQHMVVLDTTSGRSSLSCNPVEVVPRSGVGITPSSSAGAAVGSSVGIEPLQARLPPPPISTDTFASVAAEENMSNTQAHNDQALQGLSADSSKRLVSDGASNSLAGDGNPNCAQPPSLSAHPVRDLQPYPHSHPHVPQFHVSDWSYDRLMCGSIPCSHGTLGAGFGADCLELPLVDEGADDADCAGAEGKRGGLAWNRGVGSEGAGAGLGPCSTGELSVELTVSMTPNPVEPPAVIQPVAEAQPLRLHCAPFRSQTSSFKHGVRAGGTNRGGLSRDGSPAGSSSGAATAAQISCHTAPQLALPSHLQPQHSQSAGGSQLISTCAGSPVPAVRALTSCGGMPPAAHMGTSHGGYAGSAAVHQHASGALVPFLRRSVITPGIDQAGGQAGAATVAETPSADEGAPLTPGGGGAGSTSAEVEAVLAEAAVAGQQGDVPGLTEADMPEEAEVGSRLVMWPVVLRERHGRASHQMYICSLEPITPAQQQQQSSHPSTQQQDRSRSVSQKLTRQQQAEATATASTAVASPESAAAVTAATAAATAQPPAPPMVPLVAADHHSTLSANTLGAASSSVAVAAPGTESVLDTIRSWQGILSTASHSAGPGSGHCALHAVAQVQACLLDTGSLMGTPPHTQLHLHQQGAGGAAHPPPPPPPPPPVHLQHAQLSPQHSQSLSKKCKSFHSSFRRSVDSPAVDLSLQQQRQHQTQRRSLGFACESASAAQRIMQAPQPGGPTGAVLHGPAATATSATTTTLVSVGSGHCRASASTTYGPLMASMSKGGGLLGSLQPHSPLSYPQGPTNTTRPTQTSHPQSHQQHQPQLPPQLQNHSPTAPVAANMGFSPPGLIVTVGSGPAGGAAVTMVPGWQPWAGAAGSNIGSGPGGSSSGPGTGGSGALPTMLRGFAKRIRHRRKPSMPIGQDSEAGPGYEAQPGSHHPHQLHLQQHMGAGGLPADVGTSSGKAAPPSVIIIQAPGVDNGRGALAQGFHLSPEGGVGASGTAAAAAGAGTQHADSPTPSGSGAGKHGSLSPTASSHIAFCVHVVHPSGMHHESEPGLPQRSCLGQLGAPGSSSARYSHPYQQLHLQPQPALSPLALDNSERLHQPHSSQPQARVQAQAAALRLMQAQRQQKPQVQHAGRMTAGKRFAQGVQALRELTQQQQQQQSLTSVASGPSTSSASSSLASLSIDGASLTQQRQQQQQLHQLLPSPPRCHSHDVQGGASVSGTPPSPALPSAVAAAAAALRTRGVPPVSARCSAATLTSFLSPTRLRPGGAQLTNAMDNKGMAMGMDREGGREGAVAQSAAAVAVAAPALQTPSPSFYGGLLGEIQPDTES